MLITPKLEHCHTTVGRKKERLEFQSKESGGASFDPVGLVDDETGGRFGDEGRAEDGIF